MVAVLRIANWIEHHTDSDTDYTDGCGLARLPYGFQLTELLPGV